MIGRAPSGGRPAPMTDETPLSVAVRQEGPTAVLEPEGEIDISTVGLVRLRLDELPAHVQTVILDLRAVRFLDTSGLQLVVEEHRRAAHGGPEFVLVRAPEPVHRLFEIAGLADRLRIVGDPSDVTT
jgi:anti-sigma B factor antagonist